MMGAGTLAAGASFLKKGKQGLAGPRQDTIVWLAVAALGLAAMLGPVSCGGEGGQGSEPTGGLAEASPPATEGRRASPPTPTTTQPTEAVEPLTSAGAPVPRSTQSATASTAQATGTAERLTEGTDTLATRSTSSATPSTAEAADTPEPPARRTATDTPIPRRTPPRKPPPQPDLEGMAISTASFRLAVHDMVVSDIHTTVVYSVELTSGESEGEKAGLTLESALADSRGDEQRARHVHELGFAGGVALGAITFEPDGLGYREMSLVVPEFRVGGEEGETLRLDEPIDMHILTREMPEEGWRGIAKFGGVSTEAVGQLVSEFVGINPQGLVATVGYEFGGEKRYYLVRHDGSFEELSVV